MSVRVLDPNALDFDEIVSLQRRSFMGVGHAGRLGDTQTAAYYQWKYFSLGGSARIAQVRDANGLAAMCAIFSLPLVHRGASTIGWQICDIATCPSRRGKGYFMECLDALRKTLPVGDIFFGFPNINSAPGVTKIGWTKIDVLRVFAGVVFNFSQRPGVRQIEHFGPEQDILAKILAIDDRAMIERSSSYMNRRYCSAKRQLYSSFIYDDGSGCHGFIVLRPLDIFGIRCCVIIDCLAINHNIELELYLHAGSWCRKEGCIFILSFNNVWSRFGLASRGLLPILQQLSPRPLILMGQSIGVENETFINGPWVSHIGDWDGL
jgi:hypothetical protein